ncbi:uncharacterized protein LOC111268211 isoform X3 [Varroa jacobsoni]|uniref:uncharacterized protein LOC111268211 isoform X3 n=1 Tax=Varroa jacobsoni TaxID=62625 RepID=UPI000BF93591|nr:uncharacterized protein LOC111268211 isoform X3 [Varroa jacobsoni]
MNRKRKQQREAPLLDTKAADEAVRGGSTEGLVWASCEFPESMRGEWFQKSYQDPIIITRNALSKHGQCRERRHDKFLLYNSRENTYSFVVITQKHPNVMQYKETPSPLRGNWTLDQAYAELSGDTPLYSVFRIDGEPVPCPFRDTFLFSYNRGNGNCSNPPSVSDSCTDKGRVLFKFKACYDTHSESRKETLTCVGTWKEGSHHYLVGKMDHATAHSNEDRFRCFIYEELRRNGGQVGGYNVAISGDATCDGVQAPNEGSTTLVLSRSPRPKKTFPSWMYAEAHHWRTLNRSRSFEISRENSSLVIQSGSWIEQRWTCEEVYDIGENQAKIVVHAIEGCDSGYICLMVYRRAANVLELQMGKRTPRNEDACLQAYFDSSDEDYVTLLAEPPGLGEAPLRGKFTLVGVSGALFAELLRAPSSQWASGDQQMEAALQDPDRTLGSVAAREQGIDQGELQCSEQMALYSACEDNVSRFEVRAECAPEGGQRKTYGKEMAVQATWELSDDHGSTTYLVVSHRDQRDTQQQQPLLPQHQHHLSASHQHLQATLEQPPAVVAAAAATEQRFCLALTDDRRKLYLLGESTCSRRRVAIPSKLDLYREAECPPPGASGLPNSSTPSALTVLSVATCTAWLAARRIADFGNNNSHHRSNSRKRPSRIKKTTTMAARLSATLTLPQIALLSARKQSWKDTLNGAAIDELL